MNQGRRRRRNWERSDISTAERVGLLHSRYQDPRGLAFVQVHWGTWHAEREWRSPVWRRFEDVLRREDKHIFNWGVNLLHFCDNEQLNTLIYIPWLRGTWIFTRNRLSFPLLSSPNLPHTAESKHQARSLSSSSFTQAYTKTSPILEKPTCKLKSSDMPSINWPGVG